MADVNAKNAPSVIYSVLHFYILQSYFEKVFRNVALCAFQGDHYTRLRNFSKPTILQIHRLSFGILDPTIIPSLILKSLRLGHFVFNYKLTDYRVSIFQGGT